MRINRAHWAAHKLVCWTPFLKNIPVRCLASNRSIVLHPNTGIVRFERDYLYMADSGGEHNGAELPSISLDGECTILLDVEYGPKRDQFLIGGSSAYTIYVRRTILYLASSDGTAQFSLSYDRAEERTLLAITRDSSNQCRVYYDGQQEDTPKTLTGSFIPVRLGWGYGAFRLDYGRFWEARFYNRALRQSEIVGIMRNPYGAALEPTINVPVGVPSAAPPTTAIMNLLQKTNVGADLYDGTLQ